MQQRFCSCGLSVWVRYLLTSWNTVFFYSAEEEGSALLARCPCCGNKLDINTLR